MMVKKIQEIKSAKKTLKRNFKRDYFFNTMSNFLFINNSFLVKDYDDDFENFKKNFPIFSIHAEFEKLKDKPINEIKGKEETLLFCTDIKEQYKTKYINEKKEIVKFMKNNLDSHPYDCCLVKIKNISKTNDRQFSLLSVLYVHKSKYSATYNSVNSQKGYNENHLFFLFPILYGDYF